MTTYTLTGYRTGYDQDNPNGLTSATVSFVMAPGASTLSYSHAGEVLNENGVLSANLGVADLYSISFDANEAGNWGGRELETLNTFFVQLDWTDGGVSRTSYVAMVEAQSPWGGNFTEYFFQIGGDALPSFTSLSQFDAFAAQVTGISNIPSSHPLGPGQAVSLSALPGVSVSENDIVDAGSYRDNGSSLHNVFDLGDGADEIFTDIDGVTLNGGAGDDWLQVANADVTVNGGDGTDILALSNYNGDDLHLGFENGAAGDLTAYIRSDLNGVTSIQSTTVATGIEIARTYGFENVYVNGNAYDNVYRLDEAGDGLVVFDGGDGTDQLQLHRMFYEDDFGERQRGMSLDTFVTTELISGPAYALVLRDASTGQITGKLFNVEEIRFTDGIYTTQQVLDAAASSASAYSDAAENIQGTAGDDSINALGGNDTINGYEGSDRLNGGTGDDVINPGDNDDTDLITSSSGNDTIIFDTGVTGYFELNYSNLNEAITVSLNGVTNTMSVDKGTNGTDTVIGIANPLIAGWTTGGLGLFGTDQDDVFTITTDADQWLQVAGMGGSNQFNIIGDVVMRLDYRTGNGNILAFLDQGIVYNSYGGVDTISGDLWEIRGSRYDDSLVGSANDESFIGYQGNDTINGGDGFDRIRYDRSNIDRVNADLGAGSATVFFADGSTGVQTLSNLEDIRGSRSGDDSIIGGAQDNLIRGYGGNDTINGGLGDDTIYSGEGRDHLSGGAGDEDWLYTIDEDQGISVYLQWNQFRGSEGREFITDFENVLGSSYDDRIIGDSGANELLGGSGDDVIKGKGGDDTIHGNDGNDRIIAGGEEDQLYGGAGSDTIIGLSGDDLIEGNDGLDWLYGGRDQDLIYAGAGDDKVRGNIGSDVLYGEDGADDIRGGGNNDRAYGGAGNDFLLGGNGRDTLDGGAGNDVLFGGSGSSSGDGAADVFVFDSTANGSGGFDRIRDFENGLDRIDLSAFGFSSFADVEALASNRTGAMRIDFGGGDTVYIDGMSLVQFDASDVIL